MQQESASGTESNGDRLTASGSNSTVLSSEDAAFAQLEGDPYAVLVDGSLFPALGLTITSIEWERVWVTLTLEFSERPSGDVDFIIYDVLRAFPVDAEEIDERRYRIRINVTNFRQRHQLPNGSWRFLSVIGGKRGPLASYPLKRAGELAASGRSYLYNRNLSTYVITFGLSQDDRADVVMRSYQLNRPAPKAKPKTKGR